MKKLSVKMKITLWYTGLIVIILSAIFTAVLLATAMAVCVWRNWIF